MKISMHGNIIFTMLNARYGSDTENINLTAEQVKTDIESLTKIMNLDSEENLYQLLFNYIN